MLMDRLIYGCARLTGGASARESATLLRQLLDSGIRHLDVAPSYGMGTAESLIGSVIAGRTDIRVTTKAGLEPPSYALARTYARRLLAAVRTRGAVLDQPFTPVAPIPRGTDSDFSAAVLRASLARSLDRLRRDTVDLLLLHEAYAQDATATTLEFLAETERGRSATAVGYSNGAVFDTATDGAFPAELTAQVAIPPAWFTRMSPIPTRPVILHSIAKNGLYWKRTDPSFASGLARAVSSMAALRLDPTTIEIAALFALASERLPRANLIFASIDPARAGAFLTAVAAIDREIGCAAIVDAIDGRR